MNINDIHKWLCETDPERLAELWRLADQTRLEHVGQDVHLRGLVEFSNHCVRGCTYCGLRVGGDIERYRLTFDEILQCAEDATQLGYGTVVMQSGQDHGYTAQWLAEVVSAIKARTELAVTLSVGEWPDETYQLWRDAGADRYLLRFETSNRQLYDRIHPPVNGEPSDRISILKTLRAMGYEIGSGVMVGIPGQSYADLICDLETFRVLDLDMIGLGPYIPHPNTPLAQVPSADDQVPNTEAMTYKVLALTRLICPDANIPSTTALATLNKDQGRELGLNRGANVLMPNVTPMKYRALYEIYPTKVCVTETALQCRGCMGARIASIGRTIGRGQGVSPNYDNRREQSQPAERKQ